MGGQPVEDLRQLGPSAGLGRQWLDDLDVHDLIGGTAQAVDDPSAVMPGLKAGQERSQTCQDQSEQQTSEQEDGGPGNSPPSGERRC